MVAAMPSSSGVTGSIARRADHVGRHVGAGVEAVGGDARALQLLGEVEGEHDQRELRLAVGLDAAVVVLEHHVVEVDRRLPGGADVDDPGRRRALDQREQPPCQQERGEVVDLEGELVAVLALLARAGGPDPGVVDQHVDPLLVEQLVGEVADVVQGGEVSQPPLELARRARDAAPRAAPGPSPRCGRGGSGAHRSARAPSAIPLPRPSVAPVITIVRGSATLAPSPGGARLIAELDALDHLRLDSVGRRRRSRSPSIASTASMPSVTSPKTVCLPSSQGAASVVTMKNCEPFVFGPGVGHRQRAADDLVVVELVLERVAGAAGARCPPGSRPGS